MSTHSVSRLCRASLTIGGGLLAGLTTLSGTASAADARKSPHTAPSPCYGTLTLPAAYARLLDTWRPPSDFARADRMAVTQVAEAMLFTARPVMKGRPAPPVQIVLTLPAEACATLHPLAATLTQAGIQTLATPDGRTHGQSTPDHPARPHSAFGQADHPARSHPAFGHPAFGHPDADHSAADFSPPPLDLSHLDASPRVLLDTAPTPTASETTSRATQDPHPPGRPRTASPKTNHPHTPSTRPPRKPSTGSPRRTQRPSSAGPRRPQRPRIDNPRPPRTPRIGNLRPPRTPGIPSLKPPRTPSTKTPTTPKAKTPGKTSPASKGDLAVAAALARLGTPFSWGGGSPSGPTRGIGRGVSTTGFDCSGLTLYAWSKAGVKLAHYTGTQFGQGRRVPLSELRKGDLVFFGGGTGDPTHVGLYLGGGVMVHAPKTGDVVRRTSFLHSTYYRPIYRGAVRPG